MGKSRSRSRSPHGAKKRRNFESSLVEEPFCLLSMRDDPDSVLLFKGPLEELDELNDIVKNVKNNEQKYYSISMLPFSSVLERGFFATNEGEKILSIRVEKFERFSRQQIYELLPGITESCDVGEVQYEMTKNEYEKVVEDIIELEIKKGEGSSFVTPRKAHAEIKNYSPKTALIVFRRFLEFEYGAYWTFCFHDGKGNCFVGASPERQATIRNDLVLMNPISGTFRKKLNCDEDKMKKDFLEFLKDQKEIDELFMVTDEELKMMCQICPDGGAIIGPRALEMAHLIHTEYVLQGKRPSCEKMSAIDIFRATMFCPTVIGSPMGNATEVLKKYEKNKSRRYYSSAILLHGFENGKDFIDSAITIRTMEFQKKAGNSGTVLLNAGATLVKDSCPRSETLETEVKLKGALTALTKNTKVQIPLKICSETFPPKENLEIRNSELSKFWTTPHGFNLEFLEGRKILMLDNEDDFVYMIGHTFKYRGAIVKFIKPHLFDIKNVGKDDLVVVGPGPGDPNSESCPKMLAVRKAVKSLLKHKTPFLAVCLGHEFLTRELGFVIDNKEIPFQGMQMEINLFNKKEKVGFYCSFCPKYNKNAHENHKNIIKDIAVDWKSNEVNAVKGTHFMSYMFHPESILTQNGHNILAETAAYLCSRTATDLQ